MRHILVPFIGVLCIAFALPVFAQDDKTVSSAAGDLYVISAKAGGINYIEGGATVLRSDGTSGVLVKGDELASGDVLETTGSGRVELLLNPGSYARLNRSSRMELVTTSLDDLKIKILKGSAIFEVYASDDFKVTVLTPQSELYLIKTGVYRVDVLENGTARLEVWNGKAETAEDSDATLKKGRAATLDGGDVEVAKFDRGDRDEFEQWSRDRAELIAKANKKLKARMLGDSLLRGFRSDVWDCYSSVGLWVYSRRYSTYSFLPFGYGWRSPYGFGLRTSTPICYDPSYFYGRPYPGVIIGSRRGGGTSTQPRNRPIPQANIDRGNRATTPPFRRVQNNGGVRTVRSPRPMSPSSFPTFDTSRRGGSTTTTTTTTSSDTKSESSTKGKDN